METARCRAFMVSAEAGSFTRAAEQLNYTPSGVSQLVTAFENELGFALLRRTKRGVSLTESGKLIMPAVREFLAQEGRIEEIASEINGILVGSVTIAAYSSMATHWLPAVIRDFQQDYPGVRIRLMEGIWQEVMGWLDDKTADIAFVSRQEPMHHEWITLAEDPMLAILPKDHPLAGEKSYPVKRCEQDSIIMPALGRDADVDALFRQYNVTPNIHFTTLENFAAMAMAEQGLGVSIMNDLITEKRICDVVKLPLDPPSSITLGIAIPSRSGASPAVKPFMEYAIERLGPDAISG